MAAPPPAILPPTKESTEEFVPSTGFPLVSFLSKGVQPPSQIYIERDDNLTVFSTSSQPAEVVNVAVRLLKATGAIVPTTQAFRPTSNRVILTSIFDLAEGYLVDMQVFPSVAVSRGQTYVRVDRSRGRAAPSRIGFSTLISDYVSNGNAGSFPQSVIRSPLDGPGNLRSITGTTPAPGADIAETVPTAARWRLFSLRATLTTSGVVGNRFVRFLIDDGTNTFFDISDQTAQTAGLTQIYCVSVAQILQTALGFTTSLPVPIDMRLSGGYRLRTATAGILGGDTWTAPQYEVEEWLDL